jgi:hypothetical protein
MNLNGLNLNHLNLKNLKSWLSQKQCRALEEAYEGAQIIKALEEQYFKGGKITHSAHQSKVVVDYVQRLRDRQLLRVRVNLVQFQLGGFLLHYNPAHLEATAHSGGAEQQLYNDLTHTAKAEVMERLNFIESVVEKYRETLLDEVTLLKKEAEMEQLHNASPVTNQNSSHPTTSQQVHAQGSAARVWETQQKHLNLTKANSWFAGWKRRKQELTPEYEQQVINELRIRRKQNKLAMRWLLILILIPIATQILTKTLIFEPILGNYHNKHPERIELNQEMREQFYTEFAQYKESLEINQLLDMIPKLTETELKERLQEKAVDLWREASNHALMGIKNILADLVALVVFIGLVFYNRDKLTTLRSFTNRSFLNLSDPIKVFIFIFITDVFVGFHSVEGWDVILGAAFHHFGLPENVTFTKSFIASVPVFIDACIKLWIFSYLTRYSPSTSAIYERMNM